MRPYLINTMWIDLDQILFITEPCAVSLWGNEETPTHITINVQFMFLDKPKYVFLAEIWTEEEKQKQLKNAQTQFQLLFDAWNK